MRRGTVRADDDTSYLDKRIRKLANRLSDVETGRTSGTGDIDTARLEALEARLERLEEGRTHLAQRIQGQLLSVKGDMKRIKDAIEAHQATLDNLSAE